MSNKTDNRHDLTTMLIGMLLARVEAPTVRYRVTSTHGAYYRLLPFRTTGKEICVMRIDGRWCGDGSEWIVTE